MPDPVSRKPHFINIVSGRKLLSGDVVTARIRAVLPDGRFRIFCNGQVLMAKSSLDFVPGQLIKGRVEVSDKTLLFHLLDNASESAHRMPLQNQLKTLLSAALIRAGMSLAGEVETQRRVALLNRTRGPRLRVARLYAELLAKGVDPGASFLEMIGSMFSGDSHCGRSRHWPTLPQAQELREELCDNAPGNAENADSDEVVLDLLSQVSMKKDSWIFKRLTRQLDEGEFKMVWKIRRGMDPGMALSIYDGSRTFEFLLEGHERIRLAVYTDEKTTINEEQWDSFCEILTLMNIGVNDTILPVSRSDGFTSGSDKMLKELEGRI